MKSKYVFLIIIFILLNLINIIFYISPIRIEEGKALLNKIPIIFWVLMLLLLILIVYAVFNRNSKEEPLKYVFFSMIYYFIMFVYNLFFIIIPKQSDIHAVSLYNHVINTNIYLTPEKIQYFEYPFFFTFFSSLKNLLSLSDYSVINIGFFLQLLIIPIIISLFSNKRFKRMIFLAPTIFLVLIFFQFNAQMVPQFFGLLFLLLTIGSYINYSKNKSKKWFFLTLFFYFICVYSHPFMVFFFIIGFSMKRLLAYLKILEKKKNIFKNLSQSYFNRYFYKKDIPLILLLIIYFQAYFFRFDNFKNTVQLVIDPQNNYNSTWTFFKYIFNFGSEPESPIEQININTYPLYEIIPEFYYVSIKYFNMSVLLILICIIFYSVLRYISWKKIKVFDLSLFFGAIGFFLAGLMNPMILGNRAIQVLFISPSRYVHHGFKNNYFLKVLILIILVITPLSFSLNYSITSTLYGNRLVEDPSTINTGSFYSEYYGNHSSILLPDRRYYPLIIEENRTRTTYDPIPILHRLSNSSVYVDITIMSPKLENLMSYYQVEKLNYSEMTVVYDEGIGKIYL